MFRQKLFSSLIVLFLIGLAANAVTQSSVPNKSKQDVTENAPKADRGIAPITTEKIDKVGEAVGDKVDRVGDTASSYFGEWIDSPVFAGISWIKLLISLILLP